MAGAAFCHRAYRLSICSGRRVRTRRCAADFQHKGSTVPSADQNAEIVHAAKTVGFLGGKYRCSLIENAVGEIHAG